jgi:hypothetical protein
MAQSVSLSDELIKKAKTYSKIEHRSTAGQIEYWATMGMIAKDNADVPMNMIEEILISEVELLNDDVSEFVFE